MNQVLGCNGDSRGEAKVSDLNCRREGINPNSACRCRADDYMSVISGKTGAAVQKGTMRGKNRPTFPSRHIRAGS